MNLILIEHFEIQLIANMSIIILNVHELKLKK